MFRSGKFFGVFFILLIPLLLTAEGKKVKKTVSDGVKIEEKKVAVEKGKNAARRRDDSRIKGERRKNYTDMVDFHRKNRENPGLVRLKIAEFDPVKRVPTFEAEGLEGGEGKGGFSYYIIQFSGKILPYYRDEIIDMGGKVYGYIPNNSYLVGIETTRMEKVTTSLPVRWTGRYKPAYRISPSLLKPQRSQEGLDKPGTVQIKVEVFKEKDLTEVVGEIKKLDCEILRTEKGFYYNYLRLRTDEDKAVKIGKSIAGIHGVKWVERRYIPVFNNDWTRWMNQSYDTSGMGSVSVGWNAQMSEDATKVPLYAQGLLGEGQIVGSSDTGIDTDHTFFYDPSESVIHDDTGDNNFDGNLNHRKVVGYQDRCDNEDYSEGHGTHTQGSIAGDSMGVVAGGSTSYPKGNGMAPAAKLAFQDIGNSSGGIEGLPSDLNNLYIWAYDGGARLHSNSWGASSANNYTTDAENTDQFMWDHKKFLVFFSAGNSNIDNPPWSYADSVGSPGTAKNLVTVGAAESGAGDGLSSWQSTGSTSRNDPENMAEFSSHGPTREGLHKPNVVAEGGWYIWSSSADPSTFNNAGLTDKGGTSMSCPSTAGLTALVREYFMDGYYPSGSETPADGFTPSAALMKAMLISSTRNMTGDYTIDEIDNSGSQPVPSQGQGWGSIVLDKALYFSGEERDLQVYDDSVGFSSVGETEQYTVDIGSSTSQDFKVVLVWTDYPGIETSSDPLVNDLNLTVSVGGNTYKGSVFSGGYSTTGGSYDNTNPQEVVWLPGSDVAGNTATITVEANELNNLGTQGAQPFAVVVVGDLGTVPNDPPGTPSTPSGPTSGYIDSTYSFSTSATDPDGDDVAYRFAWGDGDTSAYTSYVSSGNSASMSHSYSSAGTYEITAQAKDSHGAISGWSTSHSITIEEAPSRPNVPTLIRKFDNAIYNPWHPGVSSYVCTLSVKTTDPDGDDVEFEIEWSNDPAFGTKDSKTTVTVPSGNTLVTDIPLNTPDPETLYYWRARARDPGGSNTWSGWSNVRSFTADMDLGSNSPYWYQVSGDQFSKCTMNNLAVQGDSVVLSGGSKTGRGVDVLIGENWDDGDYTGWYQSETGDTTGGWVVGTTVNLDVYEPPNFGTYYAYYDDDEVGSGAGATTKRIYYQSTAIPSDADSLLVYYEYGYRDYGTEFFGFYVFFHYPTNDIWASSSAYRSYSGSSSSGSELVDLSDTLYNGHDTLGLQERPDSFRIAWIYDDNGNWGWAAGIDSVCAYTISSDELVGTMTSPAIAYSDLTAEDGDRSHWIGFKWTKATADDSIGVQIEYKDGGSWALIPDGDLSGNSNGLYDMTSNFNSIDLSGLDPVQYDTLRLKATFVEKAGTRSATVPSLNMWAMGQQGGITPVEFQDKELVFALLPNNPNPFRRSTEIKYHVAEKRMVRLNIYDITGRRVNTLVNEEKKPGVYSINWRGTSASGKELPGGIYFLRMDAGEFRKTRKMILLK